MIRCSKCFIDRDRCDCEPEQKTETVESLTADIDKLYSLIDAKKKLILKIYQSKKMKL